MFRMRYMYFYLKNESSNTKLIPLNDWTHLWRRRQNARTSYTRHTYHLWSIPLHSIYFTQMKNGWKIWRAGVFDIVFELNHWTAGDSCAFGGLLSVRLWFLTAMRFCVVNDAVCKKATYIFSCRIQRSSFLSAVACAFSIIVWCRVWKTQKY